MLGDASAVVESFYSERHQLFGIPRVPPTPVDNGGKNFNFSLKPKEKKENSELARKSQGLNNKMPNKPCEKEELHKKQQVHSHSEKPKVDKSVAKNSEIKSPKSKKTPEPQALQKNKVAPSPQKSTKARPSSETDPASVVKKDKVKVKLEKGRENEKEKKTLEVVASTEKLQPQQKLQEQEKQEKPLRQQLENGTNKDRTKGKETSNHCEKKKRKKDESFDGLSRHKPAKLVMPEG